jgi:predicted transcriptional regulator
MRIAVTTEHMSLFQSLSSDTRIKILQILREDSKNIGELADTIGVSSAMMTRHITALETAGLIKTSSVPGKRGLQKLCSLAVDEIILEFRKDYDTKTCNSISIPVGQFMNYEVSPTCGLATTKHLIGVCDDPRYFSSPERVNAAIVWFQSGWLEYCIPRYVLPYERIDAFEISLEICSEFPGYREEWPSDLYFYLNDVLLGVWTSPGDFGAKRGMYTPEWWSERSQHGLLKTIHITDHGTMLDGIPLSDVTLDVLGIKHGQDLALKLAAPADSKNPGGLTIFGKGFGNYDQDIVIRVIS